MLFRVPVVLFSHGMVLHQQDLASARPLSVFSILPSSRFRIAWNFIVICGLSYYVVVVPLRICFMASDMTAHATIWVDCIWDAFFIADVCLRLNCFAVGVDGFLLTSPEDLRRQYGAIAWLDLVVSCPLDLLALLVSPWLLYWIRLSRLFHLHRFLECFVSLEEWMQTPGYVRTAQQFGYMIATAHWLSSFWCVSLFAYLFCCFCLE